MLRLDGCAGALTPADNPYQPVIIRGQVVEWIEGEAGWEIADRMSTEYTGGPCPRAEQRVVALIEPDRHSIGRGTTPPK